MTTLREVVAEALKASEAADGSIGWNVGNELAGDVLAAIFAPENREALRAELVERGALAPHPQVSWDGDVTAIWNADPPSPVYRFIPPDSTAGSGGAG